MQTIECQSQSTGSTRAFGNKLGQHLTTGGVILLRGDLGAGKTTFVQGLGESLGVQQSITSPTFTLMSVYPTTKHATIIQLVHIDLYRITDQEQIATLDIPQYFTEGTLLVVEWPDRAPGLWKQAPLIGEIAFSEKELNQHTLSIVGDIVTAFEN